MKLELVEFHNHLHALTMTVFTPGAEVNPPFFMEKKSNSLISLLNVHGILILYSSISGTVNTRKNQGLKGLIVLWFSSCCICGHFFLEFSKSSQKTEHVNLKLTCFVAQG